jgi:hypothetical protein
MLLGDFIDCHGPDEGEIDFLKTDVEGWEAGVIASGDLDEALAARVGY